MASRKTIFPGLAELGLEPRVKRHMENVLSPDRKQSKVYAAAASYKTHIYRYIYIMIIMSSDFFPESGCFINHRHGGSEGEADPRGPRFFLAFRCETGCMLVNTVPPEHIENKCFF